MEDTHLSNFEFLHYTQILHCLNDQWWTFGLPLCASSPILHVAMLAPKHVDPPQDYKLTQDTLLSNFYFLHYTQILHSFNIYIWYIVEN